MTIPEDQFIIKKTPRGRPKKDTTADDTASESSYTSVKEEKKRGRPRKNKEVVDKETAKINTINEMLSSIKQTENSKSQDTSLLQNESECCDGDCDCEDDENVEVEASAIKLKKNSDLGYVIVGVDDADYLITPDNQLYDPKTHDLKGIWNPKRRCVEELESDDDY